MRDYGATAPGEMFASYSIQFGTILLALIPCFYSAHELVIPRGWYFVDWVCMVVRLVEA